MLYLLMKFGEKIITAACKHWMGFEWITFYGENRRKKKTWAIENL